jgi:hypothetical protein
MRQDFARIHDSQPDRGAVYPAGWAIGRPLRPALLLPFTVVFGLILISSWFFSEAISQLYVFYFA